MKVGEIVDTKYKASSPQGRKLVGNLVSLHPMNAKKYSLDLFEAYGSGKNHENWTYLSYGPFKYHKSYLNWLKKYEYTSDPCMFAIVCNKFQSALGVAAFLNIKRTERSIEVGHVNYSPMLKNSRKGTEAMFLMMNWVFSNGYRRYEWKCNSLNIKSRVAAQRLGFSFEGIARQMTISKGRNRDTAWFAIVDKDWINIKPCFVKYLSARNVSTNQKQKLSLSSMTKSFLYKTDTMEKS